MKLHNWEEIEKEEIHDLFTRRFISGEQITMARLFMKKGCFVQLHSHENEQMSTVFSGALKFQVDGKEIIVKAGETLLIPPFVQHSAEALEDTDALDVFSPKRTDWIEGRDDYLRTKTRV